MAIKSSVTTPLRRETYKSLQLNAGVFLVDFDLSGYTNAEDLKAALASAITDGSKLLGATRGGGSFVITRDIRQVEADGVRAKFKGSEIVDSADAYISTTIIEITPQHIKDVLGNADIDDDVPGHVVVTIRMAIDDGDYLPNIIWIGDTSEGFMAIELTDALNTADFTLTFADKNEGTANAEFHAHQEGVEYTDNLPVKLHWLYPAGELGELTVSSAAGTNVGGTKITKNYTLVGGEKFVYKVGTSQAAPSIAYQEKADFSWTQWDGSSDIAVGVDANGKKMTVAVVDSYGKATMSGNCTLAVKTA